MPDLSLQSQAALSHEDRGPLLLGVSWGLTGLATVFLALRLYCKYLSKRRLWCDDYILIAAWAMILIDDILTVFLVREFGLGRHSWDLQVRDPVRFELLLSSRATVTITAIVWTKSAFAVTLLRLTAGRTRAFVWFILVTVNIAMGVSALVPWIQCRPLAKTWDKTLPGTCWAPGVGVNIWIPTGAYSAAVDFVLAALPWTFLWKLRMRKREKLGILIAMSMGVFAGVVAVVKSVTLPKLNNGDAFVATELYIWDIAESTVTMTAACIPAFRVLIRDVAELSMNLKTPELPSISIQSSSLNQGGQGNASAADNGNTLHEMRSKSQMGGAYHA